MFMYIIQHIITPILFVTLTWSIIAEEIVNNNHVCSMFMYIIQYIITYQFYL